PRHRPGIAVVVAAGLLGFVAVLLFVSMQRPEDPAPRPVDARPGAGEREPAAGVVPPEWETYEDPAAGYRIAYPPGWSVEVVDETRTDFVDPGTGAYLRVDWTPSPGDDPVAAWEAQSDSFASRYADYREIRIDETTFQGRPAAEWEFTYSDGGAALHAIDLGLVTDSRGYALNLQTPAEDWEESQDLWEAFKESFVPAGG
nr:DUF1795 domain-containing protein [Actinomycetota bacterium]